MIIRSLRQIKKVISDKSLSNEWFDVESLHAVPNINEIYLEFGKGLVRYTPFEMSVEATSYIYPQDVGRGCKNIIEEHFNILREAGFISIYSRIKAGNKRSRNFTVAVCGFEPRPDLSDENETVYIKVLNGKK